jgi:RNA polymerase sigma factor FliA
VSAKLDVPPGRAKAVDPAVDRLVREHRWLLRTVAIKLLHRIGGRLEIDDLVSLGAGGLLDAARTYDPQRATFPVYAAKKIKWAILDGVRRETHGRTALCRARALAASERFGEASADEPAIPPTQEAYQKRLQTLLGGHAAALAVGLTARPEDPDEQTDPAGDPESMALRRAHIGGLRAAVAALPDRQRSLIEQHYFEDRPFGEIALGLGLSKSRASRIHAQAIDALAKALASE